MCNESYLNEYSIDETVCDSDLLFNFHISLSIIGYKSLVPLNALYVYAIRCYVHLVSVISFDVTFISNIYI